MFILFLSLYCSNYPTGKSACFAFFILSYYSNSSTGIRAKMYSYCTKSEGNISTYITESYKAKSKTLLSTSSSGHGKI